MDYKLGFRSLEAYLAEAGSEVLSELATLEERFSKNERAERLFGSSENIRNERSQIIFALNELALEYCGVSFNDLCAGKQPSAKSMPIGSGSKGQGTSGSGKTYHGIAKAWAVLVGINHYDDPFIASLKVCVDDVTAIQQALAGRYQAARLLTDATPDRLPTRANILGELSVVAQAASEDDLLLFYFSGHGTAEGGESYLLAQDTRLSALDTTAVAMRDVRRYIEKSPAHAKVIVLDACHSGASIGKAEPTMTPEFIQRVFEEAEGIAVLASCKQGQQSWEWPEEGRSVFTYFLLDALTGKADLDGKGFVTVSDASRYVTDGVKAWAVERGVPQTPTLQYAVAGDIILLTLSGGTP